MGLLHDATTLSWDETKTYGNHIRCHGITQFLHTWDRSKARDNDPVLWGDEIEYMVVSIDDVEKNAKLALRQEELLRALKNECTTSFPESSPPTFVTECGQYMLESIPGAPYTNSVSDLLRVEYNMRHRRLLIRQQLLPQERVVTLTSFPRLGAPGVFTEPFCDPSSAGISRSLFLADEITSTHARYKTGISNMRQRRGSKPFANVPLFKDTRTPTPFIDPTIPWGRSVFPEDSEAKAGAALRDHIYLDANQFAMGCCCLQVTFQLKNLSEARRIYDALIPLTPLMMALTASSPAWRGYLADVDCRWNVMSGCSDDRTDDERGLKPLEDKHLCMPKSRYASVDLYLSEEKDNNPAYNDNPLPYDESIYCRLREHDVDDLLAKHVANLFARDALFAYSDNIDQDDTTSANHLDNILSSVWGSMRFKPPPPKSSIGWRVEFRSMEASITDFESAAYSVFLLLLTRAILHFNLNFYIPISKVDENMQNAQIRDAVQRAKFHFRKDVLPQHRSSPDMTHPELCAHAFDNCGVVENEYTKMSIDIIFNGQDDAPFPGLLSIVNTYVDSLHLDENARLQINTYLDLIRRKANGSLKTAATWIRDFVRSHPAYRFDSVIPQEINYDLIIAIDEIERGVRQAPDLLPESYYSRSKK